MDHLHLPLLERQDVFWIFNFRQTPHAWKANIATLNSCSVDTNPMWPNLFRILTSHWVRRLISEMVITNLTCREPGGGSKHYWDSTSMHRRSMRGNICWDSVSRLWALPAYFEPKEHQTMLNYEPRYSFDTTDLTSSLRWCGVEVTLKANGLCFVQEKTVKQSVKNSFFPVADKLLCLFSWAPRAAHWNVSFAWTNLLSAHFCTTQAIWSFLSIIVRLWKDSIGVSYCETDNYNSDVKTTTSYERNAKHLELFSPEKK